MRHTILTSIILLILTLSSCTTDSSNSSTEQQRIDYNYLGDAFCKCAEPTITLNRELKALQRSDKQAFLGKLKEAGTKARESMSCCKESMKNHTHSLPNPKDLRKALKQECDGLPSQLLDEIVGMISEK